MIADKICAHHLERKAILYVRQSSPHQVLHNRESGALQYAMRDRLTALGFAEIEVIDDDLGRSASGMVARPGFERLVAWLCAGEVGAVLCFDASRLARNGRCNQSRRGSEQQHAPALVGEPDEKPQREHDAEKADRVRHFPGAHRGRGSSGGPNPRDGR